MAKHVDLEAPDYSTINRRVNSLNMSIKEALVKSSGPVSVAVDAFGVKVHNGVRVKKGYLKIHLAVKTKQIVSMDVSSEKVHDGRRLKKLVRMAEENDIRVKRALADGAYDSRENFLSKSDIEPIIRVRRNSVAKSRGVPTKKASCGGAEDEGVEKNTQVRLQVEG